MREISRKEAKRNILNIQKESEKLRRERSQEHIELGNL